ncbi:MAG TPA: PKD domain-containing protein [Chitinophagales bacterium]|nr:PKD domain-containing protein [Chitinophagales bacterium]
MPHCFKIYQAVIFTLLLLLWQNHVMAQAPAIAWQKTFGGSGNDIMQDIYPTADGNYILLGLDSIVDVDVSCTLKGKHDTWVIKMDPAGNIIWQQCYGGTKEEGNPNSKIIQTSDGGYLYETETWSNDSDVTGHHDLSDAWTVKLDSAGAIEWAHSFGGTNWDVPRRLLELSGKRYLVVSRSTSSDGDVPSNIDSGAQSFDAWVFIVDKDGNIIHNYIYGGTGDDEFSDAWLLPNGNIALFGETTSTDGDLTGLPVQSTDGWLLVIDTLGNIINNRIYGQQNFEDFISALPTDDGGFICFGETGDPGIAVDHGSWHGEEDYWAVKLDSSYNIQWQGIYGGSDKEQMRDAARVPNGGGYYMAGTTKSSDGDIVNDLYNGREWWIIQIGMEGTLVWSKVFGGSETDYCYSIIDQGIAVGGTYSNDGDVIGLDGNADGWVLQLDVSSVPVVSFTYQNVLCINGMFAFTNTSSNADAYSWDFGDGFTSTETSPVHIYSSAGDYVVTLVATNSTSGISNTAVVTIEVTVVTASISAAGSTVICNGNSVLLYANTGLGLLYQWQLNGGNISGETNAAYSASQTGNYSVIVSNADGCDTSSNIISVTVNENPIVDATASNTSVCLHDSVTLSASGAQDYIWQPGNVSGQSIQVSPDIATIYSVEGTDANGCTDEDSVAIQVLSLPAISLGVDTTVCDTINFFLDAGSGFNSYLWSTGETTQTITVSATDTYWAQVQDNDGCVGTDSIFVTVVICTGGQERFSPFKIDIFPNPASTSFVLTIYNPANEKIKVELKNLLGQTISDIYDDITQDQFTKEINVSVFPPGLYFLKIILGKETTTRKLVIEK